MRIMAVRLNMMRDNGKKNPPAPPLQTGKKPSAQMIHIFNSTTLLCKSNAEKTPLTVP